MRLTLLLLLLSIGARAQELYEIVYTVRCPEPWQDSVMALNTEPPMVLYCSPTHSLVKTNAPFPTEIQARIQGDPSWYKRTIRGNYCTFIGPETDSAIVAHTLQFKGKPKKSEPILGYSTMRLEGQAIALSVKKVEVHYSPDLPGIHPWCGGLKGIPLRFIIPSDQGSYVLEASKITKKDLTDLPSLPKNAEEMETGQYMHENFLVEEDSSYVHIVGLVTDQFDAHVLGLEDVVVYEKNQEVYRTRSNFQGVYQLRLLYGKNYIIEFGTAPYVRKRVQIDLLAYRPSIPILYLELTGDLFTNPKQVDCSILQAPVLKMYYDMNAKDIIVDENYNAQRALLMQELLQKMK